jgi:hypothetical protein
VETELNGSGYSSMAGFCEHGTEPLRPTRAGIYFLEQTSNHHLYKRDFVSLPHFYRVIHSVEFFPTCIAFAHTERRGDEEQQPVG